MNQIAEVAQFLEAPAVAMAVDNSTATMSILRQEKSVARGGENGEEQPREGGQESVIVEKKGEHAAVCKWTISQFSKVNFSRCLSLHSPVDICEHRRLTKTMDLPKIQILGLGLLKREGSRRV